MNRELTAVAVVGPQQRKIISHKFFPFSSPLTLFPLRIPDPGHPYKTLPGVCQEGKGGEREFGTRVRSSVARFTSRTRIQNEKEEEDGARLGPAACSLKLHLQGGFMLRPIKRSAENS